MAFRDRFREWGSRFPEYVSAADRKKNAATEAKKLEQSGRKLRPVVIEGKKIARTFWGRSWCENLEAYSDLESRLPRGRAYARNGSVLDLQLAAGKIDALVSGSMLYTVALRLKPLDRAKWRSIVKECSGGIDSLVELLRGEFSSGVMQVITRKGTGLFPDPAEIEMTCSCPDSAYMCKHIAATLYGIGSRLDTSPDLLFVLRGVDQTELIHGAATGGAGASRATASEKVLGDTDLSALFGVEIEAQPTAQTRASNTKASAGKAQTTRSPKPVTKPAGTAGTRSPTKPTTAAVARPATKPATKAKGAIVSGTPAKKRAPSGRTEQRVQPTAAPMKKPRR